MKAPKTRPMEFDMAGLKVMIAIPVNRDFPWQTTQSLVETVIQLKNRNIEFDIQFIVGSSIIEVARSKVAHAFLKSQNNRLFMIDSDQSWKPQDFIRLLALSTKMPVVVGAYPSKKDPPTFLLSVEEGAVTSNEWGCVPVQGIGLGFAVIQRCVIETMAQNSAKVVFPESEESIAHLFRCDVIDGVFRGEDMAFFADVRAMGHKVWLDPSLEIGHVGGKEYKGKIMDAMCQVTGDKE